MVYINDFVDDLGSDAKLFADDTSLFTVVYNETVAADQLQRDLKVVIDWVYQWKMQFNPVINKQAAQVIFSQKGTKATQPPLFSMMLQLLSKMNKSTLEWLFDSALNFHIHVREKIISARKELG